MKDLRADFISDKAHLNLTYHSLIDIACEKLKGVNAIGTTGKGIGPAYSDKINRIGHRVGELLDVEKLCDSIMDGFVQNKPIYDALHVATPSRAELLVELSVYKEKLAPFIANTTNMVWDALDTNKRFF